MRTSTSMARSLAAPPSSGRSTTKQAATHLGAHLAQQLDGGGGGAAGGDQVVDQDHLFAGRDGVLVHLHVVEPYSSE